MHPYLPYDKPYINRFIQDNPTNRWAKNGGRDHIKLDYGLAITFGVDPSNLPNAKLLACYDTKEELNKRAIYANFPSANVNDFFIVLKDESLGRRQTRYLVVDNTANNWALSYLADPTIGATFYIDRPDYYPEYYDNPNQMPPAYENRNGIYCVKEAMSVSITPEGFKDILAHMSVGYIVKMTGGMPNYAANNCNETPPPMPSNTAPYTGSGQTDVWKPYENYALGDCVFFNRKEPYKDKIRPDYSVYYMSLLENNRSGVWREKWEITTGRTNIHGLYADMMGPKKALVDEPAVKKNLTEVKFKNFIPSLWWHTDQYLPTRPALPLPGAERSADYQELIFVDGSRIINDHLSLRYLKLINSGVINYTDDDGNLVPWNPLDPTYPIGNAPNILAELKFKEHVIYDYVAGVWGEAGAGYSSDEINNWIYAITQPGTLLPYLDNTGNPDFKPEYFVLNAWPLAEWEYFKPKAPKVKGLKYFAQDALDEAPRLYIFDGFRWWPAGTSTTIPPYNPLSHYVQGDVVEGYMSAKYRDIGAFIATWGIFKFEWVLDENGNKRRQWEPKTVQCLYDDVTDPANPVAAGLNGAPEVRAVIPNNAPNQDGSFFYINIDPNGPFQQWKHLNGVWQAKPDYSSTASNVTLSIDTTHIVNGVNQNPFAELARQAVQVKYRSGPNVSYTDDTNTPTTTIFDGTNDCHEFQFYHPYDKYDVFYHYTSHGYSIVYESQSKYVSGDVFDPNEYMLEWICLADLHSDWEWKQDPLKELGLPALNSRMHSQVHASPKTEWPPEDANDTEHFWDPVTNTNLYNDPKFMARLDTIYVDTENWEVYIYRYNPASNKNEYMPLGSSKCGIFTIPDIHSIPSPSNPTADPDINNPQWYVEQEVITGAPPIPVYLDDPNIGSTIILRHNLDIEPGLNNINLINYQKLKVGDFAWLRNTLNDMAVFVNITFKDVNAPHDMEALVIAAMPNTNPNVGLTFDLGLLDDPSNPLDPLMGTHLYQDFLTREIGSLLNIPVPLYYREGSIINARLRLDNDNEFGVVVRVEEHSYTPYNPTATPPIYPTIVTLIDRYDDMKMYQHSFMLRKQGEVDDLATVDFSITLNPVTKLIEQFDLNILPMFDSTTGIITTPVPDIEPETYELVDAVSTSSAVTDLRLFSKSVLTDIIIKKWSPGGTPAIPDASIDEGAVSTAKVSIDASGLITLKVDRTIPGSEMLTGSITGANPIVNGVTTPLGNNASKSRITVRTPGNDNAVWLKITGPDLYPDDANTTPGFSRINQFTPITLSGGNESKSAAHGGTRDEYLQDFGSLTFLPFIADRGPPPTVILMHQNSYLPENLFFKKTNGDIDVIRYATASTKYAWGIRLAEKIINNHSDTYSFRIDQTTGKGRLWGIEITDEDPNMIEVI